MRALLLVAAGACGVLSLASCTLLDPLDGLTGSDGSPADAAFDARAPLDATAETGNDASLAADRTSSDGPASTEGSATYDGRPSGDGASTDADAGVAPLFSDDFEGPQPLPRSWDDMYTLGGSLALDHTVYVSPDTSLEATSDAIDGAAAPNAVNVTLRTHFPMPGAAETAVYDFHVYPQQYDTQNGADAVIGALQIGDTAGDLYELQIDTHLEEDAGAMALTFAEYTGFVDGGSSYVGHPMTSTLVPGAWNEIRIELTLSQPPLAQVYLDGSLALETTVDVTIAGTMTQISLGLSYVRPNSGPWIVYYDDVYYEVDP